jgi:hypothetical protein
MFYIDFESNINQFNLKKIHFISKYQVQFIFHSENNLLIESSLQNINKYYALSIVIFLILKVKYNSHKWGLNAENHYCKITVMQNF